MNYINNLSSHLLRLNIKNIYQNANLSPCVRFIQDYAREINSANSSNRVYINIKANFKKVYNKIFLEKIAKKKIAKKIFSL